MASSAYAAVFDPRQHLRYARRAQSANCIKIFTDTVSGTKQDREGLEDALSFLREGDSLVVWRLDRLGRSLKDLIERLTELHNRNIGFKSLTESIDTTTSGGKLIFHIFGALAEFERDIIRERTNAGLTAARARGKKGAAEVPLSERKKLKRGRKIMRIKHVGDSTLQGFNIPERHL